MAEDLDEALDRQVRQLTREVADLTRQVEHEQKMRGFLEDRVQRLETSVHQKVSRAELMGWAWALVPLVVGAALLISLIVSSRPHAHDRWPGGASRRSSHACTEPHPAADLSADRGPAHRAVAGASPAAARVDPAPAQGWDLSQVEGAGAIGWLTRIPRAIRGRTQGHSTVDRAAVESAHRASQSGGVRAAHAPEPTGGGLVMAAGPQRPVNRSIHVHCTLCGRVLPGWLWIPKVPDGVMLLYHLGQQHLAVIKPYLTRMETEDIGTVAMEAFERVGGHEGG